MNYPYIRRHGHLTATRISVPAALAFLDQHATTRVPTGGRFAIAVTARTRPGHAPAVVAAAVAGRSREFGAQVALVTVAFDEPTSRMRRVLLATMWDTARSMGYQALFVTGDYRYPGSLETEIHPRTRDRRSRHRRSRTRGLEPTGEPLTHSIVQRPYTPWRSTWAAE